MLAPNYDVIVQAIKLIESRIGLAIGKQYQNDFADLFLRLADQKPYEFLTQLQSQSEASTAWQRLINVLTIGETYFLREITHFDLLRKHILPRLILERRQSGHHQLRLWSAGCASGEEPYSMAMMLHQFLPDIDRWDIEIHGTDINQYALHNAENAVYRDWAFRHTDAIFQHNYFDKVQGGYQLKSFIKEKVSFRHHNLLQHYPNGHFDIIFCKNVLLYFEEPSIEVVENHLFNSLNPTGWLFMGQAEAIRFNRQRWETHIFAGATIYQRPQRHIRHLEPVHTNLKDEVVNVTASLLDSGDEHYYAKAVEAIHQDNNNLAEHYLSLALDHRDQPVRTHILLAWIFANRRAFPEAEAHIAAALALEPLCADAHYITALIALEQERLEDAHRALQMTLYCNKYHALGAFMLGNLYAQTGQIPRAFSQWTKVQHAIQSLNPSDFVSDISDMTAGQLDALINAHLMDT